MRCFVHVSLSRGQKTIIDTADTERVMSRKWFAKPNHSGFYAVTNSKGRAPAIIYLHRFLLSAEAGQIVDHVNGDTLDNRRANLRLCTVAQNQFNRAKSANNTSGYKGVSFHQASGKWASVIREQKRSHHLGLFLSPAEAALAYDAAASCFHGEFARLNFPEGV